MTILSNQNLNLIIVFYTAHRGGGQGGAAINKAAPVVKRIARFAAKLR